MNDNTRKKFLGKLVNCFSPYGSCVGCEFQIMESSMTCRIDKYNKVIKEIEAEAIKEYVNILKQTMVIKEDYQDLTKEFLKIIHTNIDNIANIMVGENNEKI